METPQSAAMLRRREKIINEVLTTEDAYRKQLQIMVDYFETPMRVRQVIPNHAIDAIFGNLHQLIGVNQELRAYLNDCQVGEAFLKMGPFLKLYSVYAKNHHHALSTLVEWENKSARFVELKERQECRPEVKMKFNALLITPVQRIPRYKLLLDDLLNHTLPSHPDYSHLKEACEKIAQVASHINNFIREHDNFNKMLQIQRSLRGTGAPKILGPGRKFIMEGLLKRVSRKGGRAFERMFFLFSDMILYAKPRLVESGAHTYSCCCVLPLHHCDVERMFGGESGGAMMKLSCKDELLLLYHEEWDKIDCWISELKKAIKEVCQSRQSLHKESSARRPMRKPELIKSRRQERLEKIRDQAQGTPTKEGSPLVKYVRNLTDIDALCCTPKKRLNLNQTSESNEMITNSQAPVATEDSFCIADQTEVENFDVTLPQFFTKIDIRPETEASDDVDVDEDEDSSSPPQLRRTMRRSLSNLSQYSTRLRSSFRNLRQKAPSCSLRVKPRPLSVPNNLVQLFSYEDSDQESEKASSTTASSTSEASSAKPLCNLTNIDGKKAKSKSLGRVQKLKRGFNQVVDHVMSPVMESPRRAHALDGYQMVNELQNVRHLAETPADDSGEANCIMM